MKTPDTRQLLEALELQYQALAVAHERLAAGEAAAGIRRVAVEPEQATRRAYTAQALSGRTSTAPASWPAPWSRSAPTRGPRRPRCSPT